MTCPAFDIRRSTKAYINSAEQYIVVLRDVVYLRIAGAEGSYVVMTATVGEDDGSARAFENQNALVEAAFAVAKKIGTTPVPKYDFHNRPYIEVCLCEFLSDAYRVAEHLFALLESHGAGEA